MLDAKFFSSSHDEDHETPGYKTLRCTNTATSSIERWTRANSVFGHNLHEQDFASHLCNYATFDGP